ncbi:MAG: NB-ARC domain-containing protein, partial [Pseudomonadota bacterium]
MIDVHQVEKIDCQADVLLLTAVPDELEVILALGDHWIAGKDTSGYPVHRWTDQDDRIWILARATAMGGDAAANVATRLATQYRPKCLAMVGVCAGWRGKVALGDVIVADRCFRYDAGKLKVNINDGRRESVLLNDITTFNLTPQWKQYAEDMATGWGPTDWYYEKPLGYEFQENWLLANLMRENDGALGSVVAHPERSTECPDWAKVIERLETNGLITIGGKLALTAKGRKAATEAAVRYPDGLQQQRPSSKAHVAPIGSGTAVVEDPDVFPQIAQSVRKVLGVEMEGSAVAAVAKIEEVPHCVVAKGVSDHADADKDDRFRPFAIEGAYRFLKELLSTTLEPTPKKTPFIVPQKDSDAFSGRTEELKQLKDSLLGEGSANISSIAGLSGTGGIGKSGLAVRFATLNRDYFPDGVIGLRVDGRRPDELARSFAKDVGIEIAIDDERGASEIMQSVFQTKKALLIFDNAESADVRALIPGGSCKVILTTRDRALPGAIGVSSAARVDVPALPLDDALDLLRAEHQDLIDQNLEHAERIVELVGGLPLALQVVSALISHDSWREDVLAFLADELEAERNRLNALIVDDFEHLDVRASFNLSLGRMEEPEVALFGSASVCDPSGFSVMAAAAASGESETDVARTLSRLRRLSVLNSVDGTSPPRFVFHPLMLEFAKETAVEHGSAAASAERHAGFYSDLFAKTSVEQGADSPVAAELGEAVSAANWAANNNVFEQSFIISLQRWLDRSGRWENAIDLLQFYAEWPDGRLGDFARLNILNQLSKFQIRKGDFVSA